jgi:hypothetical protein
MYGDSFGKAVNKWGGDEYHSQRREWSFRREKADRGSTAHPVTGGTEGRPSSTIPRTSTSTERSGHVSPVDKEKVDDKTITTPGWKGMQIGSQEVWTNDLLGRYKVDRRSNKRELCNFLD